MRLFKYLIAISFSVALAGAGIGCGDGDDCIAQCAGSPDPAACEQQCLPFDDNSEYPEETASAGAGQALSPATSPEDGAEDEPTEEAFD